MFRCKLVINFRKISSLRKYSSHRFALANFSTSFKLIFRQHYFCQTAAVHHHSDSLAPYAITMRSEEVSSRSNRPRVNTLLHIFDQSKYWVRFSVIFDDKLITFYDRGVRMIPQRWQNIINVECNKVKFDRREKFLTELRYFG